MNITTKGRYGLKAIVELAVHDGEQPVCLHGIAERQGVSDGYLEQLMNRMKKAGLVSGVRGAAGGYHLARPAEEISVGDILRALEGSITPFACPGNEDSKGCTNAGVCVTKDVWKKIADSIERTVDGISLEELRQESLSQAEEESSAPPAPPCTCGKGE